MKRQILHSIVFVVLIFPSISAMAQLSSPRGDFLRAASSPHETRNIPNGRTMVMFSPQFLWAGQFRVEIDQRIQHRHWVTFFPHYIRNRTANKSQSGFGFGATYKWFFQELSLTYIGAGLQFARHTIDYTVSGQYGGFPEGRTTQFGTNFVIGRYLRFAPNFYGDIYVGIGLRTSSSGETEHLLRTVIPVMDVLAVSSEGWVPVVGFRLGMMLR